MATIAIIGVVATVLAAAAGAYAQYESAQTQSKVLKYNAREAEKQAEIERQKQLFQAQQQAEADRRTRAAARAVQGASGIEVGEGSSLLVDIDSARQAELNYQAIRYAGDVRVRALSAQSAIDRAQAQNVATQGNIGAGATLLGGLGSAGATYTRTTSTPKTITVPSTGGVPNTSYGDF
jgi:hypothetical protein